MVNWCPGLGTVLANEEVTSDGRSDRGNFPVFRSSLRQWMMRITAYSDRLLDDLDVLDWPEKVKTMQRNWIGRSTGAQVAVPASRRRRRHRGVHHPPDTLFGATYMVLAPEHALVDELDRRRVARRHVDPRWTGGAADPGRGGRRLPRGDRGASPTWSARRDKDKTGVFIGAYATNPVNGTQIPVFIADYVLIGYGTGAIMAVPGHDQRDWDFADEFGLPIVRTVQPADGLRRRGVHRRGPGDQLANDELILNGLGVADGEGGDHRLAGGRRRRAGRSRSTSCATGCSPGSGTGASRSRSSTTTTACAIALPEIELPVELPEIDGLLARCRSTRDDADTEPEPPLSRGRPTG